jgi:hypothetical protein
MGQFLEEHGRLIVAIVAATGVFALIGLLLGTGNGSFLSLFQKYAQESTSVYGDADIFSAVSGDIYDQGVNTPYFHVDEDIKTTFASNAFTYEDAVAQITAMYQGEAVDSSEVTVLAYWCEPVIEKSADDVNGHVVTETVNAVDKYGKYIYEDDGVTIKTTKQVKYNVSDGVEFTPGTYIDTSGENARIRLVYRVEKNSMKAECTAVYTKSRQATSSGSSASGTALVFTYSADKDGDVSADAPTESAGDSTENTEEGGATE